MPVSRLFRIDLVTRSLNVLLENPPPVQQAAVFPPPHPVQLNNHHRYHPQPLSPRPHTILSASTTTSTRHIHPLTLPPVSFVSQQSTLALSKSAGYWCWLAVEARCSSPR
ncbi:hypothetical protein BaRGS_00020680 [Batillaria attramentaria]|uniref:Uncharacterized protein n=1 Tax=Batillaria attramentaria TaxID=370345 RepID=A0ABD0KLV2_9CAEN